MSLLSLSLYLGKVIIDFDQQVLKILNQALKCFPLQPFSLGRGQVEWCEGKVCYFSANMAQRQIDAFPSATSGLATGATYPSHTPPALAWKAFKQLLAFNLFHLALRKNICTKWAAGGNFTVWQPWLGRPPASSSWSQDDNSLPFFEGSEKISALSLF